MNDADLKRILQGTKRVACLGVSTNPVRPSYFVARYLSMKGFEVWPVNPAYAGDRLFGREIAADLADLPDGIEMLDIFRASEHVPGIVDHALRVMPGLRVIWMQIGVRHEAAAARARAAGIEVVMDRCPKIEYQRLFGELRMGGFATGMISSRRGG
ncbi:CoA-binding protein [Maribius pontilimi]|uniref:CoA-binding protein n=1 Tax=Palleronia pontilimi TaxID=1964209 RepID=A0A934ICU8_9RHOB|nr:CoA-binding protein [Palleronia pontilimi]MBJ3762097.1 CoA-binding protein [Palleronia pontilimi]